MTLQKPYNAYSDYLIKTYGTKVYKLPIKLANITCPNRDGRFGHGGCIFCGESGGSFENLSDTKSVQQQLLENKSYISEKYKAKKFIAYFQNFTNTYMDDELFKSYIEDCNIDDIVGISISTRPDCINEEKLVYLDEFKKRTGIDIIIELGLQTVNYQILNKMNRGHGLWEFIDIMNKINRYGFRSCVHIIIGLPWENDLDVIETARILNVLKVDEVKVHSLFIVKNTKLEKMYNSGEIQPIKYEDFVRRVILFLRNLSKDIVIQRLLGRVPEEDSVFCNWGMSWRKIHDEIITQMNYNNIVQGDKFER